MTTKALDQHIEIDSGIAGGKPRIAGHRITVQDVVVWHERLGMTADEIANEYDLTLGGIYAALTYYYDHRLEIDKAMAEGEDLMKALREGIPSKLPLKRSRGPVGETKD